MRVMLAGALAAGVCMIVVENAQAQQSYAANAAPRFVSQPVSSSWVPAQPLVAGVIVGEPVVTGGVVTSFSSQDNALPYSYWVSAPNPARVYIEYGSFDQFPFHGRAYGSPGDRWSWYNLGGGNSRYLAKYYYPPLR